MCVCVCVYLFIGGLGVYGVCKQRKKCKHKRKINAIPKPFGIK